MRARSSNDDGGAFEGGKRQKGMREAGGDSDYHLVTVSATTNAACGEVLWMIAAVAGRVPGVEQG